MSYKTTRIYEVKLLDRMIDYDTLITNSLAALSKFSSTNPIDGYIGCALTLTYPDLDLIDRYRGGRNRRVRRFTQVQNTCFVHQEKYTRSLEGSACVFIIGLLAVILFKSSFNTNQFIVIILAIPIQMTLAKAFSPHSSDNAFLFLVGGILLFLVLELVI